jgi:hypothetical protein
MAVPQTVWVALMSAKHPKRPRDPNQLAKLIVDLATGTINEVPANLDDSGKDPAAVSLGRRGGLKGGKARAAKLTPDERRQIAQKAAEPPCCDPHDRRHHQHRCGSSGDRRQGLHRLSGAALASAAM